MSADVIARALGAQARERGNALSSRVAGNVGTRIFGGRMENAYALGSGTGASRTFAVRTVTAAASFSAFRVILAASNTAAGDAVAPNLMVAVAPLPDTSDAAIGAATYTQCTFAGAIQATLPPAATKTRRAFVFSDWMALPSVARTDGGGFPLIDIKATIWTTGAAGSVVMLGSNGGGDTFANWATRPDGRIWQMYGKGGNFSTPATAPGMTIAASIAENRSPIIGFQYVADGKVVTIGAFGDSISDGRGSYIGEGFGLPAAVALQAIGGGVAYEYANLGWAGQATVNFTTGIADAIAAGLNFDVTFLPAFSPNDITATITDAQIATMRGNLGLSLLKLAGNVSRPILWSGLPTNTSVKAYGASDAKRRAFNDGYVRTLAARGMIVADMDSVMAGIDDGSGQIQMRAGRTTDGIHPNNAGYAAMTGPAIAAIGRAMAIPVGALLAG